MRRKLTTAIQSIIAAGLIAVPGAVAAGDQNAKDPYAQPDDSWISLSGEVKSVMPDAFVLDYGDGTITVEMDDWDNDADGYKVVTGDKVTVYGDVDDDLFETTTIEASSVYVENLGTHFYASSADEEDLMVTVTTPVILSSTSAQGTVTAVDTLEREFIIDTGKRSITVDTSAMPYNPLDDEGFQKIDVGDRVSVRGDIDVGFFQDRELMADYVVELSDRRS